MAPLMLVSLCVHVPFFDSPVRAIDVPTIIPLTHPLVRNVQLDCKDHGKAIHPQHCIPTATRVRSTRPRS